MHQILSHPDLHLEAHNGHEQIHSITQTLYGVQNSSDWLQHGSTARNGYLYKVVF